MPTLPVDIYIEVEAYEIIIRVSLGSNRELEERIIDELYGDTEMQDVSDDEEIEVQEVSNDHMMRAADHILARYSNWGVIVVTAEEMKKNRPNLTPNLWGRKVV